MKNNSAPVCKVEIVDKVKEKIEASIREEGEKACFELGIHDLKPEAKMLVGRLKYRMHS